MASVIKNICFPQRYTRQGEERTKWTQCGILIEKDGKQYIKLQYIPVGMEPDQGLFFNVFDNNQGRQDNTPNQRTVPGTDDDFDDDIPF